MSSKEARAISFADVTSLKRSVSSLVIFIVRNNLLTTASIRFWGLKMRDDFNRYSGIKKRDDRVGRNRGNEFPECNILETRTPRRHQASGTETK